MPSAQVVCAVRGAIFAGRALISVGLQIGVSHLGEAALVRRFFRGEAAKEFCISKGLDGDQKRVLAPMLVFIFASHSHLYLKARTSLVYIDYFKSIIYIQFGSPPFDGFILLFYKLLLKIIVTHFKRRGTSSIYHQPSLASNPQLSASSQGASNQQNNLRHLVLGYIKMLKAINQYTETESERYIRFVQIKNMPQ